MIKKLNVPIIGLVENMSWYSPKNENEKHFIFGKDGGRELAENYKIDLLAQIPLVDQDTKFLYENQDIQFLFDNIASSVIEKTEKMRSNSRETIPQVNVQEE